MYLNHLTIIGFTGSEADIHYTTIGTLVTTLSVATKEWWKNAQGEWQSRTEWGHRVVLFGRLAEYGRTLAKGSHVMAQGSVRTGIMRERPRLLEETRTRAVWVRPLPPTIS